MLHAFEHFALGPVRVVSTPVRLDDAGFTPAPATPAFGSEACEILRGLGFTEVEIDGFLAAGGPRTPPAQPPSGGAPERPGGPGPARPPHRGGRPPSPRA